MNGEAAAPEEDGQIKKSKKVKKVRVAERCQRDKAGLHARSAHALTKLLILCNHRVSVCVQAAAEPEPEAAAPQEEPAKKKKKKVSKRCAYKPQAGA